MFKLVGKETFTVGKADTKATINIDAISGFAYEYTLEINGKSLKKYMENRSKVTSTWILNLDGTDCRIVLGKNCPPSSSWIYDIFWGGIYMKVLMCSSTCFASYSGVSRVEVGVDQTISALLRAKH